jgi:hypothetical protein
VADYEEVDLTMAKYRMVSTHFWDDGFIRKLPAGDKLLFLYLITNPCTNIAGAYEITLERMSFDTGMDQKRLTAALERLQEADKVTYKDDWVLVHNFIKNQSRSEMIDKGIETAVNSSPDWIKQTLSIRYKDVLGNLNLNSNLNSNSKRKKKASFDARVVEVFEEWKSILNKKSSLDLSRQKTILARLDGGFTVDDLKLVPHGAKLSPWHMGQNPDKKKYIEVSTLFRDNEQVEKFIDLAKTPTVQISATQGVKVSQEELAEQFERQHYNDRAMPMVVIANV